MLSLLHVRPDAAGGGAEPRWMVVGSSCCSAAYLTHEASMACMSSIPIAEATLQSVQTVQTLPPQLQPAQLAGGAEAGAAPLAPTAPLAVAPVVAAVIAAGSGRYAVGGYSAGGMLQLDGATQDPD